MSKSRHSLGQKGESAAAAYLEGQGYRIIARNFRTAFGEIDLVARDQQRYIFIEVKTRRTLTYGQPEEAVTGAKMRRLSRLAQGFLNQHRLEEVPVRFDVISVIEHGESMRIKHFVDAFEAVEF